MYDVKKCESCQQEVVLNQFPGTDDVPINICNNCLCRYGSTTQILAKFTLWSRTCKNFSSMNNIGTVLLSNYSAPLLQKTVIYALVNKEDRKTFVQKLLEITGDVGDGLLLSECIEELNKLQDNLQ